jgi:hypothetical protein
MENEGFTTHIIIAHLGEEDEYGEKEDFKINKEIKNHLNQLKNSIVKEPDFGIRDMSIHDYECYVEYASSDFPENEIKKLLDELVKLNEGVSIKVQSWDNNDWECFGGFGCKKGFRCDQYGAFESEEEYETDRDRIISDTIAELEHYWD